MPAGNLEADKSFLSGMLGSTRRGGFFFSMWKFLRSLDYYAKKGSTCVVWFMMTTMTMKCKMVRKKKRIEEVKEIRNELRNSMWVGGGGCGVCGVRTCQVRSEHARGPHGRAYRAAIRDAQVVNVLRGSLEVLTALFCSIFLFLFPAGLIKCRGEIQIDLRGCEYVNDI